MEIERIDEVALLRLRGGKANAMSADFLAGVQRLFDAVESSDAAAVVLTGYEGYFSAGLALPLLVNLDRPAMATFIDLFGNTMLRVFRCERPVVAAINGHAIAGGCVLALQADARLIAEGKPKIGLNEVRLGIGLPATVIEPLRLQVPPTSLTPIALDGALFTPDEALRLGLVHEVLPADQLLARAVARARELARSPLPGYAQAKRALRRPAVDAILAHGAAEREAWLDTWFSDTARVRLLDVVAKLGGG
jgi:enoyl-CoA hydratase